MKCEPILYQRRPVSDLRCICKVDIASAITVQSGDNALLSTSEVLDTSFPSLPVRDRRSLFSSFPFSQISVSHFLSL